MEYSGIYREVQICSSGTATFENALKIASRIWCEATGNDCLPKSHKHAAPLYHHIPDYDTILHQAIEATKDRDAFVVLLWQPMGTYTKAFKTEEVPAWATDKDIAKDRLVPVSCAILSQGLPPHKNYLVGALPVAECNLWYGGRFATLSQYGQQGNSKLLWNAAMREVFETKGAQQLIFSRRVGENDSSGNVNPHGYKDGLATWYTREFGSPTVIPVPEQTNAETGELEKRGLLEAVYTYSAEAYFEKLQERVAAAHNIRSMVAIAR